MDVLERVTFTNDVNFMSSDEAHEWKRKWELWGGKRKDRFPREKYIDIEPITGYISCYEGEIPLTEEQLDRLIVLLQKVKKDWNHS